MIYANNAGTSWPKPEAVHAAVATALSNPPGANDALFEQASGSVAQALGCGSPSRLLFTPGCTSALAIAIGDLPWQAGDVIVTSALEHHALMRPIDKLAREREVVHRIAPYAPGDPIDLDFVEARLREGRVRLVAATAASNVTGERLPVQALATLAHAHGALLLLDAAQTFGLLPQAQGDSGADIVTFAGHKGPLGPHGIGGLWAAPEVSFDSPAVACTLDGSPSHELQGFPGYCDLGSVNAAGLAGLAAGLEWKLGRAAESPDPVALATGMRAALHERAGVRVFGGSGTSPADFTATVSIAIDGLPLPDVERFFAKRGIAVRAGQHCAPMALAAIDAPEGTLRISLGHFNTQADVSEILAAVDRATHLPAA